MSESFHLLTWHIMKDRHLCVWMAKRIWAYWHATSYKEGILKIVLSGGDADTNAAVAGAILGAKFGISQISEEWKDSLLYTSLLHNKVQDFYALYR